VEQECTDGDLDRAFAKGDHHFVAASNREDRWQTYAALGLCANTRPALEGLARFDDAEARFYEGVTHWIDGNDEAAIRLLSLCHDEHARNLLALIRKPKISVLTQLPWQRSMAGPHSILHAGEKDGKFQLKNLSFAEADAPYRVGANIHDFYDASAPPDFYLAEMVEWQMIPPNLQEIPCPTIGHTADFDMHIQGLYPWLQAFDELFVTDTTERAGVVGLVDVPVTTVPKAFAMPCKIPKEPNEERPLDVVVTGNVFHPYFDEKAALYGALRQLPNMRNGFFNGFVGHYNYYELLKQSKLSIVFIRRPGALPSRGVEALSVGAGVLAQQESVMGLWVGEEEGFHTYDSTASGLRQAVERIFDAVDNFQKAALRGMKVVREEFNPWRVASQYLRTAAYVAARPRGQRKAVPQPKQYRTAAWRGWLQADMQNTYTELRNAHFEEWKQITPDTHTADSLTKPARELLLEYSGRVRQLWTPNDTHFVDAALNIMRTGMQMHPASLALRFNFIRSALHFGNENDMDAATELLRQTIDSSPDDFELAPLDDIMTWDYCNEFFNYKRYFEIVTHNIRSADQALPVLKDIIFASLHCYSGRFTGKADHYAKAIALDPDFAMYQMCHARELAASGDHEATAQALPILQTLVLESVYPVDAWTLLQSLELDQGLKAENEAALYRQIVSIFTQTIEDKERDVLPFSPYDISQRLGHFNDTGVDEVRMHVSGTPEISILLSDANGSRYPMFYASVQQQTLARDRYEIVSTDAFSHTSKVVEANADTILLSHQTFYLPIFNMGYNLSFVHGRGDIVILLHEDIALPANALEQVLQIFSNPEAPPYCITNTGGAVGDFGGAYFAAMTRRNFLHAQGVDESPFFAGLYGGPAELIKRMRACGKVVVELEDLPNTPPPIQIGQHLESLMNAIAPDTDSAHRQTPIAENPYIQALRENLS
jgi:hypothetical protein